MQRVLVVLVCLAVTPAAADSKDGFETYKGARKLCSVHVASKGAHVDFSTHATVDDVAKVVAFYEKSTGKKATKQVKGNMLIEKDKGWMLTVYEASQNDKFPSCEEKPIAGEKAVILISQGITGK